MATRRRARSESPKTPRPHRRRWFGAVSLLVLFALGLLVVGGRSGKQTKVAEPAAPASTAHAPFATPRGQSSPRGAAPAAGASDSIEDDPPAAAALGLNNLPQGPPPYPPGSQPLTAGVDPAMHPKDEVPISPRDGIKCVFGPRIAIVHPPDPMVIDLEVHNSLDALLPIGRGVARFRPDNSDPNGTWFEAPLVDDGTGKDLAGGDRKYTATFLPSDAEKASLFKGGTHVFVEVFFEAPQGLGPRKFPTVMEYSRQPNASLSGKYSDDVENGSLVVSAKVTAKQGGDYRLIASLYAAGTDTAIAFASKSLHLDAGDGAIPLLFFGKILYEKGIDGPYELRYVMLFEDIVGVDSIPGETIDHAYTTRLYRAKSFSSSAYTAPAPTFANVDRNHPSQRDKPPPLLGDDTNGPAPSALATGSSRAAPAPTGSEK